MNKLALLSLLIACGDNHGAPDAAAADGATVDAPPAPPRAFVVSGDFQPGHPGASAMIDTKTLAVTTSAAPAGAVGDDPVVRKFGGELFVVNRSDGNNVTILDATTHALHEQLGTGANSNPQDVAVVGDTLYVPVYGGTGVAVLTRGSTAIDTIDLGADDPDGHPDCESIYLVGDELFVACQLLGNFSPRGPGKIYIVDPGTKAIKRTITMQTDNPFSLLEPLPGGDLVVSTVGSFDGTGCIERVTANASSCIITDAKLGGYANRVDVQVLGTTGLMVWLAVSGTDFQHPKGNVQAFDMMTSSLWPDPISPMSELVVDVAACPDGTVIAADQAKASGGVRVFRDAKEVTKSPLVIGLVPSSTHGMECY